jgi:hypothetical protein
MVPSLKHFCYCLKALLYRFGKLFRSVHLVVACHGAFFKTFLLLFKNTALFCPIKTVRELGRYLVLWYINLLVFYSTIEIGKILRFEVC